MAGAQGAGVTDRPMYGSESPMPPPAPPTPPPRKKKEQHGKSNNNKNSSPPISRKLVGGPITVPCFFVLTKFLVEPTKTEAEQ